MIILNYLISNYSGYRYTIQTVTGTKSRSDTGDKVYIILYGSKGVSQKKRLNTPKDDFEKGR